jgi:hypothetical protein
MDRYPLFAELSSIIMINTNYPEKICALWSVFLLGTLFHTQLGLMPLFHDLSVVQSHANSVDSINWVLWLMLAFFTIPMMVIILTVFTHSMRYRKLHLGITIVYSVLNISHLAADLMVQPIFWYQIALMAILVGVGLLLNWVSYQWIQCRRTLQILN